MRLPQQFATKYNDHQVMGKEFNRRWLRAGDEERTNVPVMLRMLTVRLTPT